MAARRLPIILIAEDDLGDRVLLQEAFEATGLALDLRFVADGEDLLGYLRHLPPWTTVETPDLILLDLCIAREVLGEIKKDPEVRCIPVILLTKSQTQDDVADAYERGANTSIPKPLSADEMVHTVGVLGEFWLRVCTLPVKTGQGRSRPADEMHD